MCTSLARQPARTIPSRSPGPAGRADERRTPQRIVPTVRSPAERRAIRIAPAGTGVIGRDAQPLEGRALRDDLPVAGVDAPQDIELGDARRLFLLGGQGIEEIERALAPRWHGLLRHAAILAAREGG